MRIAAFRNRFSLSHRAAQKPLHTFCSMLWAAKIVLPLLASLITVVY